MKNVNIAIDGPAGAGKSSIAKTVARKMGYLYIDTGAMYRAVGVLLMRKNIELSDKAEIDKVLANVDIKIDVREDGQHIYIDGEDMNPFIRTPEASMMASSVAVLADVRLKLVEIQRKIAAENNVIMDGRDIGTYVLPDANVKIFLTASPEERAGRRYKELMEKGENCSFEAVLSDMILRDEQDSKREFAPLKQADDSILLDTTGLSFDTSVSKVVEIIEKSLKK